jgi:hypothetical protein
MVRAGALRARRRGPAPGSLNAMNTVTCLKVCRATRSRHKMLSHAYMYYLWMQSIVIPAQKTYWFAPLRSHSRGLHERSSCSWTRQRTEADEIKAWKTMSLVQTREYYEDQLKLSYGSVVYIRVSLLGFTEIQHECAKTAKTKSRVIHCPQTLNKY